VTNTLAYYGTEKITTVKRFVVEAPRTINVLAGSIIAILQWHVL
jgi:hypothetical protein